MQNYVIERTIDGAVQTLSAIVSAETPDQAIIKAFDLTRIVTGVSLPPDGKWTARLATGSD